MLVIVDSRHRTARHSWLPVALAAAILAGCADEKAGPHAGQDATAPDTAAPDATSPDAAALDAAASDAAAPDAASPGGECALRVAENCSSDDRCAAILATPIELTNACRIDAERFVGCHPASQGCDDAITYAKDEQGDAWQLANGCLPARWTLLSAQEAPKLDPESCVSDLIEGTCALFAAENCSAVPDCMPVSARRYDANRRCVQEALVEVGCVQRKACDQALTYVQDPERNSWELGNGCVPLLWQVVRPESVSPGATGTLPRCQ